MKNPCLSLSGISIPAWPVVLVLLNIGLILLILGHLRGTVGLAERHLQGLDAV
jgi:hypothetical protein